MQFCIKIMHNVIMHSTLDDFHISDIVTKLLGYIKKRVREGEREKDREREPTGDIT